jgi:hypothetical protein
MIDKPNDYPISECLSAAQPLWEAGAITYQKFTCTNCGSRQTISTPNRFFDSGSCEECHHITNILSTGCNYLLVHKKGPSFGKRKR